MPTLEESLTRLAERGSHTHPNTVIAAARAAVADAQHNVIRVSDDRDSYVELAAAGSGRRLSRRVPIFAAAMLCTAAIGAGLVIARQRVNAPAAQAPIKFSEPQTPSPLTESERQAAILRCASSLNTRSSSDQLTGIVDRRPGGLLVGVTTPATWQTCAVPDEPGAQQVDGPWFGPLSLIPAPTMELPVAVIDAKSPDGNQINGDEIVWVWGRVDPTVTRVEISSSTARYVPTIENGLYAAWWPGNDGDETVVRWFDAAGTELGFIDQLNCGSTTGPIEVPGVGLFTPMTPRLVVGGTYVSGGCIGGENVPAGTTGDEIGD